MPDQTRFYAFTALLLISLLAFGAPGHAQETDAALATQKAGQPRDDKLLAVGKELSAALEQQSAELVELRKKAFKSEGDEKAILLGQVRNKRKELAGTLKGYVAYIEDLEAAGQDTRQPRKFAREMLLNMATGSQGVIERNMKEITQLREQRASVAPEEQQALNARVEELGKALDEDLETYFSLTQLMVAQDIDATRQQQFLDASLQAVAERLSSVLRYLSEKRSSVAPLSPGASEEEKKARADELATLNNSIKRVAEHLNATIGIMKGRELETAAYTKLLIQTTGELTEDIFTGKVALGLLQGWLENAKDWVIDNGPRWLFKIIVFLLILAAFKFLARIVQRLVRKAVTASRDMSQLLQNQIISFAGKAVMFLGLLVALSQLGIQLAPVLAGLGIAGFIIGFALQDTLSNFAAGVMILVYRPYDVGDAVEAGGVMGSVKAMNLVSTTIATWDNQKLVVPNSKIWGDVIRNITAEPHRRVDLTFGISYADDIDHAERVLWDIVKSSELVLAEPETVIALHSLGESSVDFVVRPWARTSDYWTVYWDITRKVKKRFDEEGISIPFPQRDVHLVQGKEGAE